MAIKLERDENGNVIAVDKDTGKKVGSVHTMGDEQKSTKKKKLDKK